MVVGCPGPPLYALSSMTCHGAAGLLRLKTRISTTLCPGEYAVSTSVTKRAG